MNCWPVALQQPSKIQQLFGRKSSPVLALAWVADTLQLQKRHGSLQNAKMPHCNKCLINFKRMQKNLFFSSLYGIVILPPLPKLLHIQLKKTFFSLKSHKRKITAFQLETVLLILRPWTKKAKSFLAVSAQQRVQGIVGTNHPPSFTERYQYACRMEHSHCQQTLRESSLFSLWKRWWWLWGT